MRAMEKRGKHMADITPDEQGLFVIPNVDDGDSLPMVSASELAERSAQLAAGDTNDLSATREVVLPDVPKYLMPSKAYDVLKWIGLIVCYALAILIRKVGGAWHFDADIVDATATTVEAVGLFIGMCIRASQVSAMGR